MDSHVKQQLEQANILIKQGNLTSAAMTLRKVLKKFPKDVQALKLMLKISIQKNDIANQQQLIQTLLAIVPEDLESLTAYLGVLEVKQDYFTAVEIADRILTISPEDLVTTYRKGLSSLNSGKIEQAERLFLTCQDANFSDPFLHINLGHVYKAKGESVKAAECYHHFIKQLPAQSGVGYWSLADLKDHKFSQSQCQELEQLVQRNANNSMNHGLLLFALGRAFEQTGQADNSFKAMAQANHIVGHNRPFKADLFANLVKSFIHTVSQPYKAEANRTKVTPIFIVGMPRSGTTLVEQILAAHSKVETTDELPYLERIGLELEMRGGYAKALVDMSDEQADFYAQQYLDQAKRYFKDGCEYFIDKNPNNFLHIGLIKRLFPHAKMINVVRDPLDNAMSVYKQYFSFGHDYSYSLNGIVFYWQGYLSLMFHWLNLYKQGIYNLSYEQLTADPDNQIKQLIDAQGLDFEAQCLTFYDSKRAVLTPSVSQVKQPINQKSVGSWQKYQAHLKPAMPAFEQIRQKCKELLAYTKQSEIA